jgi:hypothetical protein
MHSRNHVHVASVLATREGLMQRPTWFLSLARREQRDEITYGWPGHKGNHTIYGSCRRFDPGVPRPTSKLSLRVPAQMDRRETEHKGGETVRGTAASCCPAPRTDALAVGGYKRSRGRERGRETARQPVLPCGHILVREPWTFLL